MAIRTSRPEHSHDTANWLTDPDHSLTDYERLVIVLDYPGIFDVLGDPRPVSRPNGRRPSTYPDYIYAIIAVAGPMLGSERKAISMLRQPHYWGVLLRAVESHFGVDARNSLPPIGPSRAQWLYNKRRYQEGIDMIEEKFDAEAARLAVEAGLFNRNNGKHLKTPARGNCLVGDGTVLRTHKGKRAQAIQANNHEDSAMESASGLHHEGGDDKGKPIFGTKFVLISARLDNTPNCRVILSTRHLAPTTGDGGEAALAMEMIERIYSSLPFVQAVCWDGAFRGKHRDRIMKLGMLAVTRQHKATKKARHLETEHCTCGRTHDLWTKYGTLAYRTVDIDGHEQFIPIKAKRLMRRGDPGNWRWYFEIELPCGRIRRVRIDNTNDDIKSGTNRAEHLQQLVPDTPEHNRTYGFRADAESLNNTLDRRLGTGFLHHRRAASQRLFMVGFALAQNALAWATHRARHSSLNLAA